MEYAQGILDKRQIIVCVISLFITSCSCDLLCNPAQEGQSYTITREGRDCQHQVTWWYMSNKTTNEDSYICAQDTNGGWNCRFQNIFTGDSLSGLTILNISRTPRDLETRYNWTCGTADSGSSNPESCMLQVYAKPINPNCSASLTATSDSLDLSCWTSKVYPEAKCVFTANGKTTKITLGPESDIVYNTNQLPSTHPVYYSTTCTTTIPVGQLTIGPFSFEVNMYPDVTNGASYSTRITRDTGITLSYPSASLDPNCFQYVKRDDKAVCTCKTGNPGFPRGSVQWFKKDSPNPIETGTSGSVQDPGRLEVDFDSADQYPEYVCKGNSVLGSNPTGESFIPRFAYGPEKDALEIRSNHSGPLNICPGKIPNVMVTCVLPTSSVEPYSVFSASFEESSQENKINGSKNGNDYIYSKTFTLKDSAKNTVWCAAENGKFPGYNVQKKQISLDLREPPRSPPVFMIRDKEYPNMSNLTVDGHENSSINVECTVKDGVPEVSNITVRCGENQLSAEDKKVELHLTVSRTVVNLNCTCWAHHVTRCYDNNQAVLMLEFTFDRYVPSELSENEDNTAAIAGGVVAGILVITGIVIAVVVMKRKGIIGKSKNSKQSLTRRHGSPAADDEITHTNDLYGPVAPKATGASPYEDMKSSDNGTDQYSNNAFSRTKDESDVYENTKSQEANNKKGKGLAPGRYVSKEGLIYTEVEISGPSKSSASQSASLRPRILEDGVQYAAVEFKK